MEKEKDPSYISVYVPSGGGNYNSQISPVKTSSRRTTLRRWWNGLSRLQKSLILMFLLVFLIFGVFAFGLNPADNYPSSEYYKQQYAPHKNNKFQSAQIGVGLAELKSEEKPQPPINNKFRSSTNYQKYGKVLHSKDDDSEIELQITTSKTIKPYHQTMKLDRNFKESPKKPVNIQLPTSPRSLLSPDIVDSTDIIKKDTNKPQEGDKLVNKAEAIRHVISLDPVIPWNLAQKDQQDKKTSIKPSHSSLSVIEEIPKLNGNIFKKETGKLKFEGPQNPRQQAVVDAFLFAWNGYRTQAWGKDHLRPVSGGGSDWFGLGLTMVDSLDTMYIMGLNRQFYEARDWVEESLRFDISKNVNLFETTIRVLGGLLSAYHLSDDKMFLDKSQELGEILLVAFKSPSGIPYSDVNLYRKAAHGPSWNPDSTTAEVTTLQLEFRDLGRSTNKLYFEEAAFNVSKRIHKEEKFEGLVPIHISPQTGVFRMYSTITLGARGDSYYEYLLKQWIQTGKTIDFLKDDYLNAVEGMKNKLMRKTLFNNLTYFGELDNGGKVFRPKMDHLVCYLPGTLALGYANGLPSWHMDIAKELIYTCYQTYIQNPTGLAGEITYFNLDDDLKRDFYVKPADAHNLLRPETVESLWYMYRVTGDKMYQDWGWEIFQSFLKHTKTNYGFSSINNVLSTDVRPRDVMESFWMGETLKYFYLLFCSDDKPLFDLSKYVFNTEAHPMPVFDH